MIAETLITEKTIGDIVTDDFRAAHIFKNAGIDFCCGGKKSLDQACKEKGIDPPLLAEELNNLGIEGDRMHNFKDWDPGFLCDYIVNTHHKFVLKALPDLVFYTRKIADVHGFNHPELKTIAGLIEKVNEELLQHLKNEEEVLFPVIKSIQENNSQEKRQVIESEIARMTGEHEFAGGALDQINEITSGYKLPADACKSYQVAFKLLEQFEDDLHIHVHLENNILYPKALKL